MVASVLGYGGKTVFQEARVRSWEVETTKENEEFLIELNKI